jgi:starvation-inducible outer membrane lipoprotein
VASPATVPTAPPPILSPALPAGPTPATDLETLKALSVASLSPAQGVEDRNLGARVRWVGGVQHLATTNEGVCLTVLYADNDDGGAPRWTAEAPRQSFVACTDGAYDPTLISEFTNVTVVGRISGRSSISFGGGSSSGPVVQIERLFRWSDCLEGDESTACRYGFISPQVDHVD